MRALLDTHTFLWWITDDPRLSPKARDVLSDEGNTLFVSAASGWKIAIKAQIGKLTLRDEPEVLIPEQIAANGFIPLPIQIAHALRVYALPLHHRDPFDRLLVAQSQIEGLPLVSADGLLAPYAVDIIW